MIFNPFGLFIAFDARVQRLFDKAMRKLMLAGIPKRFIRYSVWSFLIFAYAVNGYCGWRLRGLGSWDAHSARIHPDLRAHEEAQ
jgi:hypothetical protein